LSDQELRVLAEAAGVALSYRDVFGVPQTTGVPALRSVLAALDLPTETPAAIAESRQQLLRPAAIPPLLTGDVGEALSLPHRPGRFQLFMEDGSVTEGMAGEHFGGALLPPVSVPGYHRLALDGVETTLAIAPPSCFTVEEAVAGRGRARPWGIAVQLYGLRRAGDAGIGDTAALQTFARRAASQGADAIAISPVHAQFSADPDRFSPYAPSSRIAFNVMHVPVEPFAGSAALEANAFVDWPNASRARLKALRRTFEAAAGTALYDEFETFRRRSGDVLERHARFETLHAERFLQHGQWHWRDWPAELRDPAGPAVEAYARAHASEVTFHAFLQFLAERGLAAAQAAAREAGMGIGLISDLAVGTDGGGSHAWSRQAEMLIGLSVGAPPDLLSPQGQNWGLAAFSPLGLIRNGFSAFIEMLRAALRHAGGVRIDHVMGLARLWVVPDGASAADGAYLHFPLDDLLRLVALESRRHGAIVVGEDLGTLPEGFQERLIARRLLGLRVLWFERSAEQFLSPAGWSRNAAAVTSTHDLATVAGWWSGRDLEWRKRLNLFKDDNAMWFEYENRAADRARLWHAMVQSGTASADAPEPQSPAPVVDAAIAHVGRAACELAILPIEDLLGLEEQPNLPGTLDEHPNWRRRLEAPVETVLEGQAISARLASLRQ
jgi:4-alpha-glucanotransferase